MWGTRHHPRSPKTRDLKNFNLLGQLCLQFFTLNVTIISYTAKAASYFAYKLALSPSNLMAALLMATMFLSTTKVWKITVSPFFHAFTFKVSPG